MYQLPKAPGLIVTFGFCHGPDRLEIIVDDPPALPVFEFERGAVLAAAEFALGAAAYRRPGLFTPALTLGLRALRRDGCLLAAGQLIQQRQLLGPQLVQAGRAHLFGR